MLYKIYFFQKEREKYYYCYTVEPTLLTPSNRLPRLIAAATATKNLNPKRIVNLNIK